MEATRKIRELTDHKQSQVRIVALTCHAQSKDRRQACLDAGCDYVEGKPIDRAGLTTLLERFADTPHV